MSGGKGSEGGKSSDATVVWETDDDGDDDVWDFDDDDYEDDWD